MSLNNGSRFHMPQRTVILYNIFSDSYIPLVADIELCQRNNKQKRLKKRRGCCYRPVLIPLGKRAAPRQWHCSWGLSHSPLFHKSWRWRCWNRSGCIPRFCNSTRPRQRLQCLRLPVPVLEDETASWFGILGIIPDHSLLAKFPKLMYSHFRI